MRSIDVWINLQGPLSTPYAAFDFTVLSRPLGGALWSERVRVPGRAYARRDGSSGRGVINPGLK